MLITITGINNGLLTENESVKGIRSEDEMYKDSIIREYVLLLLF